MPLIRIATNLEQVEQNIRVFQTELKSSRLNNGLVDKLSHFRAWYALKEKNGKWLFGPSKFVGYVGMTAKAYTDAKTFNQLDGRKTEEAINPWFREVVLGPLHDELYENLHEFLASFGKHPSSLARISICRDGLGDADEAPKDVGGVVEALLTIFREMPAEAQQEFRRRMKKEI